MYISIYIYIHTRIHTHTVCVCAGVESLVAASNKMDTGKVSTPKFGHIFVTNCLVKLTFIYVYMSCCDRTMIILCAIADTHRQAAAGWSLVTFF